MKLFKVITLLDRSIELHPNPFIVVGMKAVVRDNKRMYRLFGILSKYRTMSLFSNLVIRIETSPPLHLAHGVNCTIDRIRLKVNSSIELIWRNGLNAHAFPIDSENGVILDSNAINSIATNATTGFETTRLGWKVTRMSDTQLKFTIRNGYHTLHHINE